MARRSRRQDVRRDAPGPISPWPEDGDRPFLLLAESEPPACFVMT
jgi:hypothetical protein